MTPADSILLPFAPHPECDRLSTAELRDELREAPAAADERLEILHKLPSEDRDPLLEIWLVQERRLILAEINKRNPGADSFPHLRENNPAESISGLITWNEFLTVALTARQWTLEGLLPEKGLAVLQGRGKQGKSTLALHLCSAIAAGKGFLERPNKQKPIVYINYEMPDDYLQELIRSKEIPSNAYVLNWPESVLRLETVGAVIDKIADASGLAVIDSFRGAFKLTGKGENLAGEAGVLLRRLQELAVIKGWIILVIHHGKRTTADGTDSIAGTGDWIAAPDVIWSWSRTEATKPGTLIVEGRIPPIEPLSVRLSIDECNFLGSVKETQDESDKQAIYRVLTSDGQNSDAIAEAAKLAPGTARARLETMYKAGQVNREGSGKRGSPYLWSKIFSAESDSYSAETNSGEWEDVTSGAA